MFSFIADKYYSKEKGLVYLRYKTKVVLESDGKGYIEYIDSRNRKCKMQVYKNEKGYLWVSLALRNKKRMSCRINRLVYSNLIGEIPKDYEVDHIDRNKENNTLDNLRIVTRTENEKNKDIKLGEDRKESKLTNEQAREICYLSVNHLLPRKEIAKKFNVSEATVKSIRAGRNWKFCTLDILTETNCIK